MKDGNTSSSGCCRLFFIEEHMVLTLGELLDAVKDLPRDTPLLRDGHGPQPFTKVELGKAFYIKDGDYWLRQHDFWTDELTIKYGPPVPCIWIN